MKIIATDIANLTDARYFAAWGVDGLAYNIDPSSANSISSAQLKEIAEWVEGPETTIKLDGLENYLFRRSELTVFKGFV